MADRTKRRPRRLVEPAALVDISLWDMLEAAMAADGALTPPKSGKVAELSADVPASEPAPARSRRARRRASVA